MVSQKIRWISLDGRVMVPQIKWKSIQLASQGEREPPSRWKELEKDPFREQDQQAWEPGEGQKGRCGAPRGCGMDQTTRPREWMNEHTRPAQHTLAPPPPWGHRPHCSSSHTKIETELKAPAALRSDLIFCHTEHSLTGRDSRRRFSKRKGVNNCLSEWAPTTG